MQFAFFRNQIFIKIKGCTQCNSESVFVNPSWENKVRLKAKKAKKATPTPSEPLMVDRTVMVPFLFDQIGSFGWVRWVVEVPPFHPYAPAPSRLPFDPLFHSPLFRPPIPLPPLPSLIPLGDFRKYLKCLKYLLLS